MAGKFCSNCGAPLEDTAKYCPGCGTQAPQPQQTQPVQQQPFQQYPPPYAPVPAPKPKSKAPLIVGGIAGVLVVALVIALVVTKGFGLLGKQGETGGGTAITVPKDASDEELAAYAFIDGMLSLYESGLESIKTGPDVTVEYFCGTAAASICSMRYAVDLLMESKGGVPAQDGRLNDWDMIAALGWASPYPYLFEGVVHEAQGDMNAAKSCYEKSALNPKLGKESAYLRLMAGMDVKQLQGLRAALTELEDKIFAVCTKADMAVPRSEYNFSAAYLRAEGRKALKADANARYAALSYYLAALRVDPYDGDTYAGAVMLYIDLKAPEEAALWLETGLLLAPENATLKTLYNTIKGAVNP